MAARIGSDPKKIYTDHTPPLSAQAQALTRGISALIPKKTRPDGDEKNLQLLNLTAQLSTLVTSLAKTVEAIATKLPELERRLSRLESVPHNKSESRLTQIECRVSTLEKEASDQEAQLYEIESQLETLGILACEESPTSPTAEEEWEPCEAENSPDPAVIAPTSSGD